jgi:hypothetical protein
MSDDELAGTGGGADEGEGESSLAPPEGDYPDGYWPPWDAKLRNDFRSAENAKSNDGLISPTFRDPPWTSEPGAHTAEILEAARRRGTQAADRGTTAEARAQRIVQVGLTMLTVAFVVAGFTASRVRAGDAAGWWWIAVAVTIVPILLLALTITQAVSVDRVGYVHPAEPGPAAASDDEDEQRRNLIRQEARAALMANWTARHKVNEFLQARAWLTRSIAALGAAGIAACLTWLYVAPAPTTAPAINVDVHVSSPDTTTTAPATTAVSTTTNTTSTSGP